MDAIFFEEYKLRQEEIRQNFPDVTGMSILQEAAKRVLDLSYTARHDGILAMEEYAMKLPDNTIGDKYLKKMILLVVDGSDPQDVFEIGIMEEISMNGQGYQGLALLMYLQGILQVQAGTNTAMIEAYMKSMIPKELV